MIGDGNIHVHSWPERRYRCRRCRKTFAATTGTVFYRRSTDPAVLITVLTLLVHGCPPQAIVAAFGVDERTVATWQAAAGTHGRRVQDHLVEAGRVELGHVQADELRGKLVGGVVWLATALAVPSRLWRGGAISVRRDEALLRAVCGRVRAAAAGAARSDQQRRVPRLPARDLARLPGTGADGETRSATIGLARRVAGRAGRQAAGAGAGGGDRAAGRARQRGGDPGDGAGDGHRQRPQHGIHRAPACDVAGAAGAAGAAGTGDWPNRATAQGCGLAVGTAYNFCWAHEALRQPAPPGSRRKWRERTPAMAAGLTDRVWTLAELLAYRVPPPWMAPTRSAAVPPRRYLAHCAAGSLVITVQWSRTCRSIVLEKNA